MEIVLHLTEDVRGISYQSLPLSRGTAKGWSGSFPGKRVATILHSVLQQRKPENVGNDSGIKAFHVVVAAPAGVARIYIGGVPRTQF